MSASLMSAESVDPLSSVTQRLGDDRAQRRHAEIGVLALVVEATVVDGHIRIPLDVNIGQDVAVSFLSFQ